MLDQHAAVAPRRGRPRKFAQPSRSVTLTLPESVIAALEGVDPDLGRAVVRLAQPELAKRPRLPVELAHFGRGAVIVVTPTRTLEQRTGVTLVPLSDGRALIAFDESMTAALLELKLEDVLEARDLPAKDALIFSGVLDVLRDARRSKSVGLRQRNIIVLEQIDKRARRR
jgi:hypothetical protein